MNPHVHRTQRNGHRIVRGLVVGYLTFMAFVLISVLAGLGPLEFGVGVVLGAGAGVLAARDRQPHSPATGPAA